MYFCGKIVMCVYVVISVVGVHGCAGGGCGENRLLWTFLYIFLGAS